jgi:hypothetical protein
MLDALVEKDYNYNFALTLMAEKYARINDAKRK